MSRRLVTIGACATAGGVQALRNFADVEEYLSIVYARPEFISTLADSTPIAAHVPVDFELRGCPIDKRQLVEVLSAFLHDRRPEVPEHSVCVECKLRGNVCVMVAHGTPCLGPATHAGCGALCPSYHRGCYGCFGPMETPNVAALADQLGRGGVEPTDLVRLLRTFNTWSPAFRAESEARFAATTGVPVSLSRERPSVRARWRRDPRGDRTPPAGAGARPRRRRRGHARRDPGRQGRRRAGPHLRAAPVLRSLPAGPGLHRAGRPDRPHLRHLPGRLPDERLPGHRRRLRRHRRRPPPTLRRLLYCGEWIESHTLHVYLLHAPDFLGLANAVELATRERAALERGLRLKKTGNDLVELVGGRPIHPINVRVGGFYRVPTRGELAPIAARLEQALTDALDTVRWVAGFDFPDFERDYTFVSLREPERYPVLQGRVVSNRGLDVPEQELLDHVTEEHVGHSTALHAHLAGGETYLVGPLARYSLNADRLMPAAAEAARAAGLDGVCRNPFRSIVVRAVEVVHACETALAVIDALRAA